MYCLSSDKILIPYISPSEDIITIESLVVTMNLTMNLQSWKMSISKNYRLYILIYFWTLFFYIKFCEFNVNSIFSIFLIMLIIFTFACKESSSMRPLLIVWWAGPSPGKEKLWVWTPQSGEGLEPLVLHLFCKRLPSSVY